MWLIRVALTRTLIGFSLRMLATHTSFSSTSTGQLLVSCLCLSSSAVWNADKDNSCDDKKTLSNERGQGPKEGGESEKEVQTQHQFPPPIKATQHADDLYPVWFPRTDNSPTHHCARTHTKPLLPHSLPPEVEDEPLLAGGHWPQGRIKGVYWCTPSSTLRYSDIWLIRQMCHRGSIHTYQVEPLSW